MRRAAAQVLIFALLPWTTQASLLHVHQEAVHEHEHHHDFPAAHTHIAIKALSDQTSLEACDPLAHVLAIVCTSDRGGGMLSLVAQNRAANPCHSLTLIPLTLAALEVRVHGPPRGNDGLRAPPPPPSA